MNDKRLVGIDLGVASAHTVRVLAGDGRTIAKRKVWPTAESLAQLEAAALSGAQPGTRLEVVIEPTGPAWFPVAVFFDARGHIVYRVSSAKAADLRRFLSRHAKSNGIDAETLARLPLVDPAGLQPLMLPGPERAALDRRVRAADRLSELAARHKVRIKALVRQLLPMSPLTGALGRSDLAVLERFADPRMLVKAGRARLTKVIARASNNQKGAARADEWLAAARASLALYADHPAMAFGDLAAEVATEVRLLQAAQTELARHEEERESCYRWVDPLALARSLPGLAEIGGPALVACMGDARRFPSTSETGESDRKGQPMSKAGSSLLRVTLIRAAENARREDPQLARIYWVQMTERGKDHLGALCVVGANLAERAWATLERGMPYVICDTEGAPVTPEEAKAIIAKRFTVTEETRRRSRSKKKAGKAPQKVLQGHSRPGARGAGERGDPPRHPSSRGVAREVKAPA
jgi:transposase